MLKLLCAIPENVGWVIVGAMGAFAVVGVIHFAKFLIKVWKEWHEED